MAPFQAALDALKTAATNGKTSKEVQDTVDRVSSSLTLLKLSSPSLNTKKTIASTLRSPFVSLYNALPFQTLNLSLALFNNISNDKIAKLELEDEEGRSSWEAVQTSIFSGMLDYVEESDNNESKEAVAGAFYSTICSKFFPVSEPSSAAIVGVSLRSTAYMVLYESAENHSGNQRKLRDPNMLGGKRLGKILCETKDFLAVETLFTLFARLLPSINSGHSGRAKRSKFIQEVFLQSSLNCGQELIKVLEEVSKAAWEDTVVLLMDILAKNNITFPQPFDLDEIRVCGTVFPQPTMSERLYLDTTCFFGNIVDDSDSYESLQIRYADVLSIDLASGPSVTQVTVNLSAPAIVAEATMKTSGALTAAFDIKTGDIKRFAEALSSRGLDTRISEQRTRAKMSFPSLSLNMDHGGRPTLSREDQVKDVERAYGLDQSSDTSGPMDIMEEAIVLVKPTTAPTSSGLPGWAIMPDAPSPSDANTTGSVPHPFSRTETQVPRDVAFGKPDELSNIDGEENLETTPIKCDPKPKASGRSSITIVTSPDLKGRITKSDDDMDKPIALKAAGGKKASAKKTVIESETEDYDVEVQKTIDLGWNPLRAGRRTRASAALAGRLEAVAAAAAKSSVARIDDHTTTATTKHIKRSDRAAPVSKTSTNSTGKALLQKASLAAAEVALPVSDDLHPHPIAQSVGEPRITSPSERSATSRALDGTFSSFYTSDHTPQVLPDKVDAAGKSTVHIAPGGRAAGMKRRRNDVPQDSSAPVKATHKRQKGAKLDGGEVESRPVKRQRGRTQAEEVNLWPASPEKENTSGMVHTKTPASTLAAKHYGKKGKSSSPPPSGVLKVDYDELPSAIMLDTTKVSSSIQQRRSPREAARIAKAVSTAASGTRASVMRGKEIFGSSAVTKVKTDTMRTKTRAKRALNTDDVKIPHVHAINPPETKRVTRSTMRKPDVKEPLEEKNKLPKADNDVYTTTKNATLDPAKANKAPWEALNFKDSILEVQVTQTQLTNYEPAQIDKDKHVEDVVMEYTVPTKVDSSSDEPVYVSIPRQDAVMIDLTQESPLKINKKSHDNPIIVNDDYIPHPLPTQIVSIMQPTPNARPRQSVTFAPSVDSRSPSPTSYDRDRLFLSPPDHNKTIHSPTPKSDLGQIEMHNQDYYLTSQKKHQGTRNAGGEMQDIVDVLNNIQNEVVRNLSNKFEGVKKDVRVGRDRILREAASDLYEMRGDGVRNFNSLVDLEKDYAAHRRQNIQGWEDVKKINLEICQLISHKIKDHDRGSVSKKLPKLLFSIPIPDSLLKPSLRRK